MHVLYTFPFSCSFAVALELARFGLPFELRDVPRGAGRRVTAEALDGLNPTGKVPVLVTPDGEVVTEIVAILLHLARTHGPTRGPAEELRLVADLAFVATEVHQAILGPLFDPSSPSAVRRDVSQRLLPPVLDVLEARLDDGLLGARRSPADAYIFWALLLLDRADPWGEGRPALRAVVRRASGEPHIRAALRRERARWKAGS